MSPHSPDMLYLSAVILYQCAMGILLAAGYLIFSSWEKRHPWRPSLESRWLRIKRHFGLFLIARWALWLIFPAMAFGFSYLWTMGWLHQVKWPWIAEVVAGILALDFIMYIQHRALHSMGFLWRVHRVHHMDTDVDATTAVRFHPLEALFTVGSKIIGIAFFGIMPLTVAIYEILLGASLFFAHMNVRLSPVVDSRLRKLWVTPGMHRIHHSDETLEHNRNFGFCFSFWDKIIGSYRYQAEAGYHKIPLGLVHYHDPKYQTLENMLLIPFNTRALKPHQAKPLVTQFKIKS